MGKNSKQNFSSSQCWAIWTVYGMKCFWCKKQLEFAECKIDHVIPKTVSKIVLSSIIKEYNLGSDFSASGYENWVPSCSPCLRARAKGAYRPTPALPGLFKLIRINLPKIEAKVDQIERNQSIEAQLREIVQKLESGEVSQEYAEQVIGPFLRSIEGTPNGTVEFRLSESVRLFSSPDGLRMQPISEIRYQKFVEGMVESGDWKRKSTEQIREGPTFGEGRPRRPATGA